MEEIILKLVSIAIAFIGLLMFINPKLIAYKLKDFYSKYPFTRYAGEKQLTSKLIYIRMAAITFILLGILCFFTSG